jgi:hypothetical protein
MEKAITDLLRLRQLRDYLVNSPTLQVRSLFKG